MNDDLSGVNRLFLFSGLSWIILYCPPPIPAALLPGFILPFSQQKHPQLVKEAVYDQFLT
jgi:hypothetical protein